MIVDLGRENTHVALLAWSIPAHGRFQPVSAAASPRYESKIRQSSPIRLDNNATLVYIPILLWELQTVEEPKIHTYEFAAEEAVLPHLVLSTGRTLCTAWAYISYRPREVSLA